MISSQLYLSWTGNGTVETWSLESLEDVNIHVCILFVMDLALFCPMRFFSPLFFDLLDVDVVGWIELIISCNISRS